MIIIHIQKNATKLLKKKITKKINIVTANFV